MEMKDVEALGDGEIWGFATCPDLQCSLLGLVISVLQLFRQTMRIIIFLSPLGQKISWISNIQKDNHTIENAYFLVAHNRVMWTKLYGPSAIGI